MSKSFIDSLFTPDLTGTLGELYTHHELNLVRLFGRHGKVLRNVYVPKDDGTTSEIDLVFITQKGIFVIESKNYSGWIFGNENHGFWTASLPGGQKNKFYNPIKQNKTHIKWLKNYLGGEITMFSMIVFSDRCELKKITVESPDVRVIHRERLFYNIKELWRENSDILSAQQVKEIFEKLKQLTKVDISVKQEHIADIKRKYDKPVYTPESPVEVPPAMEPETIPEPDMTVRSVDEILAAAPVVEKPAPVPAQPENLICPRCGSALVLRQAKKGKNAGNSFYGCSAFPKCRYIKNVE